MKRLLISAVLAGVLFAVPASYAQVLFVATLNGSNEPSMPATTAAGTFWGVLSADRSTLTYRITYAGLTSPFTGSHFHLGAAGVNGPVLKSIAFNGNTAAGTWTSLPDSTVRDLMEGYLYVNIHTQNNPGGEIRGQVVMQPGIGATISLDGFQETPPTSTTAMGTGFVVLNGTGTVIRYGATIAGLSGSFSASHFHVGAPGVAGGVVEPLAFTDSTTGGMWTGFSDDALSALLKGNLYMNVHSSSYPGGEIRGQVLPVGDITFTADLNAASESGSVVSTGKGTFWGILSKDLSTLLYRITYSNLSSSFTGSHFHLGAPGTSGPVVKPIAFSGNTASGSWTSVPDSIVLQLVKGNVYVNIHSSNYPAGELRGQLETVEATGFPITLDGSQETPPTGSTATGTGYVALDSTGTMIEYSATISGLEGTYTAAHFHIGAPGVSGSVVEPVTFADSTVSGMWTGFSDDVLTALLDGNLYLNVHTTMFPGGEIRGQVVYGGNLLVAGIATTPDAVPGTFSLYQNYPNPFNPSTVISFDLPKTERVTLRIFNILGENVATLIDDVVPAGRTTATFDASRFASGVYFYDLSTGSGLRQTRKMLLLK